MNKLTILLIDMYREWSYDVIVGEHSSMSE